MPGLQFTYHAFVAAVEMSRLPHILLEGTRDSNFFEKLCESVGITTGRVSGQRTDVVIHTAEDLTSGLAIEGNRGKVESICQLIDNEGIGTPFLGFVDREFREFTFGDSIVDDIQSQRWEGSLVWSRGHSIENYLFQFEVIKAPLQDSLADAEVAQNSVSVLQDQFPSVLNVGCALGQTAREYGMLQHVRAAIDERMVLVSDAGISIDVDRLRSELVARGHLNSERSLRFEERYSHWHDIAKESDPQCIRWACDGHIGFKLIWTTYSSIVREVAERLNRPNPERLSRQTLTSAEGVRFNYCTSSWITRARCPRMDTPFVCLDKLLPNFTTAS